MTTMNRREAFGLVGGSLAVSLAANMATAAENEQAAKPRIKIGQIGVGHAHAARQLQSRRESPDFEVVGIVEPDEELRRRAAENPIFQGLPWMTQEQLLNVPGLQAVMVETQVDKLLDAAEVCVNAGKHIHLDKPAGESLPQFKRILDSAARQKLFVQMGYVFRYNPGVLLLRDLLKRGWFGEVFEVQAVMSEANTPEKRKELARYRGGILFELGGHLIDVVVGMLGKPQQVTPYSQRVSPLDDTLADNMLAVLSYPRAIATVKSSAVEVEGSKRRHLVVCGTEGTLHIQPLDNPVGRLTLSQARGEYPAGTQEIKFPKFKRYVNEAAEMARVIRGEQAPVFSYDHDLAVQTTLLQACGLPINEDQK
jgi:predicted dehydrogenase